jgi:hypothetical protein
MKSQGQEPLPGSCSRPPSAFTELIAAGVDVRTVAGRLGHLDGGSTMLRTYSAFVLEADQRATAALAGRRPNAVVRPPRDT